ncbi:MAG: GNAT family N-acetyltransferase [Rubrivivax sp.]|nr:GNAT family N-acetyltransferase [Rubrivivax sp.]
MTTAATTPPAWTMRRLMHIGPQQLDDLAQLLVAVVEGGASVGFMLPMSPGKARAFWQRVGAAVQRGERALLVAEDAAGRVVGTVQLIVDQPENQPHRADLAKMQVSPHLQRRGLGAALMHAAEALAREMGKTVLVLDTVTGSAADRLYTRLGWQRVGEVPNFALWPGGGHCPTTFFHKQLV